MNAKTATLAALAFCAGTYAHAGIYKCVQPDGIIEYSGLPCGPNETRDYVTGDTFSVTTRSPAASKEALRAPMSDREIRRQQQMAAESAQTETGAAQ
ncbi:MAG: hypothetical protein K9L70_04605 [Thiohalocapsa sp.]|nr:hypothetical protein [Thiohalocapsa sp.]MCF7991379.1 hypothetical protein [Thiohalocapsa sp.]